MHSGGSARNHRFRLPLSTIALLEFRVKCGIQPVWCAPARMSPGDTRPRRRPAGPRALQRVIFTLSAPPTLRAPGGNRSAEAGGDLDVVDVPAVESTATVASDVEAELHGVARVHAGLGQVDLRRAPRADDLATV